MYCLLHQGLRSQSCTLTSKHIFIPIDQKRRAHFGHGQIPTVKNPLQPTGRKGIGPWLRVPCDPTCLVLRFLNCHLVASVVSPLGSPGTPGLIGLNLKGGVGEAGQQEQTRQGGYMDGKASTKGRPHRTSTKDLHVNSTRGCPTELAEPVLRAAPSI